VVHPNLYSTRKYRYIRHIFISTFTYNGQVQALSLSTYSLSCQIIRKVTLHKAFLAVSLILICFVISKRIAVFMSFPIYLNLSLSAYFNIVRFWAFVLVPLPLFLF
jgi:hypothetical protein